LGKVIRLTAGHQAKVEEKPEVRKAGGVYYTPTYIVDYIVKNTVGKLLDGEGSSSPQPSPQRGEGDSLSLERESASSSSLSLERERVRVRVNQKGLTPAQASDLRILDPACGSGSFLLGAYQYLLDWHLEHYQKSVTLSAAKGLRSDSSLSVTPSSSSGQALSEAKNRRPSPSVTPSPSRGLALGSTSVPLYQDSQGNWRLTTAERKRILLNSIYGVDIDSQAVEVTKLSLLLKVLEGENQETLGSQLKLYHERALPDLGSNIKCGNSLIGPDFYQGEQQTMFADEEERLRINTFDWNQGFPDIMKAGGFDAVIGNPPYVRQELLGDLKDYFQHQFRTYHGVADLYVYFIERGVNLLSRGGLFAFIVVSKWMRTSYGQPIRDWLLTQDVKRVVDFGDLAVFKGATTYTCILVVGKGAPVKSVVVTKVHTLAFPSLDEYVQQNSYNAARKTLSSETWSLADGRSQALLVKLNEAGKPLSEYVNGRVFYGVKTGFNGAFVVDKETRSRLIKTHKSSTDVLKPFLVGKDIRRYMPLSSNRYVIFTRRGVDIDKYPAIRRYLEQFRDRITPKPPDWKGKEWHGRKPGSYKWYEIQDTVDYYPEFEKPKIVWPGISGEVCAFALDTVGYYGNDNIQIVGTDERFLLGVLNSGVAKFILKHTCDVVQGGFFRLKMVYIERLPVPCLTPGDARQGKVAALVETMLKLHKDLPKAKTPHEQESLQRQIAATDKQIDALVYELYGLTEEEIETVEVSLKQ
ncbi:MAG: Eco57I restriction-modification methylase domain-containing protein, partial [candidate division WOR-3 bacterium]|nr:Eco57I restriction-modification methylase domain-containing protein [candidate division WOR-3 bacterium]